MKCIFLEGSPKVKGSNTAYILNGLAEYLSKHAEISYEHVRKGVPKGICDSICASDALIIAFPLYVDGIPSHLLKVLVTLQSQLEKKECNTKVYVLVNSGFYEAKQSHLAIQMLEIWCEESGLTWGQGLALGAGEMVQSSPIGKGPSTNIGKALDKLSTIILERESSETVFVEPNFPRLLYKLFAHFGWYSTARKNGISFKGLYKKHK